MARGVKLENISKQDINKLSLAEANKLIKESAADLNRRVASLKSAKQISREDADNALKYLRERARASRPKARSMGQPRLKNAQFSKQASRTLKGARSRLKEMKAAADSKTTIRRIQDTNRKRRATFSFEKMNLDRMISDDEMRTVGKAINRLKAAGHPDSEQVVEVYTMLKKNKRSSMIKDADTIADLVGEMLDKGKIPDEEFEKLMEITKSGKTISTSWDDKGTMHTYITDNKTGEVTELK